MTPQARYLALLEAERARRTGAGHDDDPRQRLLDQLSAMAERLAAAPQHHLCVDDMSPAEMLACHLLPDELRPAGVRSEDEIWAEVRRRNTPNR